MARSRFSFTADVWEHQGPAAWHFVSLPEAVADEIEATYGHRARVDIDLPGPQARHVRV